MTQTCQNKLVFIKALKFFEFSMIIDVTTIKIVG